MARPGGKAGMVGAAALAVAATLTACTATEASGPPGTVTVTQTLAETLTETVSAADAELADIEEQRAALDDRKANLDARERKLNQRKRELDRRERRLARQEAIAARSRFGDGTYLVGSDIPAGSYVAGGGETCYWERSTPGATGIDAIIDNYIGAGQARATVYDGELFQTQGCGEWRPG